MSESRPTDPDSLKRFMADMNAYAAKEIIRPMDDDAIEAKAIVVDHHPGERVRLVGSDEIRTWGWVTALTARLGGTVTYEVSWPGTRAASWHHGLELESAE